MNVRGATEKQSATAQNLTERDRTGQDSFLIVIETLHDT